MKQKTIYLVNSLMMLAFAVCVSLSMMSCEERDELLVNESLVGTWYRSEKSGKTTYWEEYTFCKDGTGYYKNSNGTTADYTYNTDSPGLINYQITWWHANGGYYRDKYAWQYWIEDGILHLDGKKFTKKY